jgi:murein DD-endopeptidase MepM/ murein hydrolase activator NlpD
MHGGDMPREVPGTGAGASERRLWVCSPTGNRLVVLGRGRQLLLGAVLFLLSGLLAFAIAGQLLMHSRLAAKDDEIRHLERHFAAARDEWAGSEARLRRSLADLDEALHQQRTTSRRLRDLHEALRIELDAAERQLVALVEERDSALGLAQSLGQGVQDAETWLRSTVREKAALTARLAAAESRLQAIAAERDEARRGERALSWRVEVLETRLERTRMARESQYAWFRSWVGGQAGNIESLLSESGIEIDVLLHRAIEENGLGQGGPFQALDDVEQGRLIPAAFGNLDVEDDLARMVAMQRLLVSLPLAVPLDQYYITSAFGGRRDPITRRQAFHAGLDFGAPADTPILAASPGRVVHAGRAGPYGIMVDIDHGMGIVTRYAHLRETTVEEGDWVGFRDQIGIIGATGRATGRHLHYEIRIDGEPLDPAQFIEAGRRLIHVFKG